MPLYYNRGKYGRRFKSSYRTRTARKKSNYSKYYIPRPRISRKNQDMALTRATPYFKTGKRSWPKAMTATLPYCEEVTLDAGSNSYALYTFRQNSIWDPNVSGVGHQPYGFDQYGTVYQNWGVKNSRIRVWPAPYVVTDSVPGYFAVIKSQTSTGFVFTSVAHFLEFCSDQNIPVYQFGSFTHDVGNHGKPWADVKNSFNLGKEFGTNTADSNMWGTTTLDIPIAFMEYYHLYVYTVAQNNPSAMNFRVQIDYETIFFNKKIMTESV